VSKEKFDSWIKIYLQLQERFFWHVLHSNMIFVLTDYV